VKLEHRER